MTRLVKVAPDRNHLEATRTFEPGLERGQGGQVGVFIMGGLETTLDEMEYLLEAKKEKKFRPQRSGGEVAAMCRLLLERRNELIKHYQKNPSAAPKKKKVRMYLPVGLRYVSTSEPGLKMLARA